MEERRDADEAARGGRALEHRYHYLQVCAESSHQQILRHITLRGDYLKYQLFAMGALFAISQGLAVGLLQPKESLQLDLLVLAFPISFMLAAFYCAEDRLVAHFCEYFGSLSFLERDLAGGGLLIPNSEISEPLRVFSETTLTLRVLAQASAFFLIPSVLTVYRFIHYGSPVHGAAAQAEIVMDSVLAGCTVLLLFWTYHHHRRVAVNLDLVATSPDSRPDPAAAKTAEPAATTDVAV